MKKILSFSIILSVCTLSFLLSAFSPNPINSLLPSAFSLFSVSAYAEEKTASLEEIVVTATRIEEPKKDVPSSVQIITGDDIKNSTAKDAGDLIAEASIGHIHKYPGDLTVSIALRGFRTDLFITLKDRVLVLINGNRVKKFSQFFIKVF